MNKIDIPLARLTKKTDSHKVRNERGMKTEGKTLLNGSTTAEGRLGLSRAAAILIDE